MAVMWKYLVSFGELPGIGGIYNGKYLPMVHIEFNILKPSVLWSFWDINEQEWRKARLKRTFEVHYELVKMAKCVDLSLLTLLLFCILDN